VSESVVHNGRYCEESYKYFVILFSRATAIYTRKALGTELTVVYFIMLVLPERVLCFGSESPS
jgi:hypothetical protein